MPNKKKPKANKNKVADDARPLKGTGKNICVNLECKLRKGGCKGFEGCPGYKAKE